MKTKALILGFEGITLDDERCSLECIPWSLISLSINLRDYDVVIIDLLSISSLSIDEATVLSEILSVSVCLQMLASKARIIILGDPRFSIQRRLPQADIDSRKKAVQTIHASRRQSSPDEVQLTTETVEFLEWTGMVFTWDDGSGNSIVDISGPLEVADYSSKYYEKYLGHLKEYLYSLKNVALLNKTISLFSSVFPGSPSKLELTISRQDKKRTRYGYAVAFNVILKLRISEFRYQEYGNIVFLPSVCEAENDSVSWAIEDALNVVVKAPEPEWLASMIAPGQEDIDRRTTAVVEEIEHLSSESERLKQERQNARYPLQLLYQTSVYLEQAVREVLRKLGADVEDPPKNENKEDGWITITIDNVLFEGVLEIKGTTKQQHSNDGLRQLMDWKNRGTEIRKKMYKGIIIGNSLREKPINERDNPFSSEYIETARLNDIVALCAEDLYLLYVASEKQRLDNDRFWTELFNTSGPLNIEGLLADAASSNGDSS